MASRYRPRFLHSFSEGEKECPPGPPQPKATGIPRHDPGTDRDTDPGFRTASALAGQATGLLQESSGEAIVAVSWSRRSAPRTCGGLPPYLGSCRRRVPRTGLERAWHLSACTHRQIAGSKGHATPPRQTAMATFLNRPGRNRLPMETAVRACYRTLLRFLLPVEHSHMRTINPLRNGAT